MGTGLAISIYDGNKRLAVVQDKYDARTLDALSHIENIVTVLNNLNRWDLPSILNALLLNWYDAAPGQAQAIKELVQANDDEVIEDDSYCSVLYVTDEAMDNVLAYANMEIVINLDEHTIDGGDLLHESDIEDYFNQQDEGAVIRITILDRYFETYCYDFTNKPEFYEWLNYIRDVGDFDSPSYSQQRGIVWKID